MKNTLLEDMDLSVRAYQRIKQMNYSLRRAGLEPIVDTNSLLSYTEKELKLLFIGMNLTLRELLNLYSKYAQSYINIRKQAGIR